MKLETEFGKIEINPYKAFGFSTYIDVYKNLMRLEIYFSRRSHPVVATFRDSDELFKKARELLEAIKYSSIYGVPALYSLQEDISSLDNEEN